MTDVTTTYNIEHNNVIKQDLLALAERVLNRYEYLMKVCLRKDNGQLLPITPDESAAILMRLNDGTINRNGSKILTDEVIKRNQEFLDSIPMVAEQLKKMDIEFPLMEKNTC